MVPKGRGKTPDHASVGVVRPPRTRPKAVIVVSVLTVRRARIEDTPRLWALNNLPNIGATADPTIPIDLLIPDGPPPAFPDLADVEVNFVHAGGDFIVVEEEFAIVGMGGFRPRLDGRAEMLRVRVHPARRRLGIGRALVGELERRAGDGARRDAPRHGDEPA